MGNNTFDYNVDGLAHIGMLPDLIADLEALGLTQDEIAPLLSSADGYVSVWQHAWSKNTVFKDAQFIAQQPPPASMTPGMQAPVSGTMLNTGMTTWRAEDGYALAALGDSQAWGMSRVALPRPVGPKEDVTFEWTVTAPGPPSGVFAWQMVRNGDARFGQDTPLVTVLTEPAACAGLRDSIAANRAEIQGLQADLQTAEPGEKAQIAREIRTLQQENNRLAGEAAGLGCG